MNVIDQAFVKAYSRRTKPQPPESATEQAVPSESAQLGPADLSVHPQAAETVVVWVDAVADQYLRRDAPHRPHAAPHSDSDSDSDALPRLRTHIVPPAPRVAAASDEPASLSNPSADTAVQSVDLSFLCHTQIAFAAEPQRPASGPAPAIRPEWVAGSAPLAPAPSPSPSPAPSPAPAPASNGPPAIAPAAVAPMPSAEKSFTAAWEVDTLEFSSTVMALFGDRALMNSIGVPLDRAVREGLQTLMVTSDRPGAGQTSVATGIALSAAAAGLRVALVDANSATGRANSLADALNLEVQQGWLEAIRSGLSVTEVAIHSIEDQLTVIPQIPLRGNSGPTADEFACMMCFLRQGFDLIVVDGPCCQQTAFNTITAAHSQNAERTRNEERAIPAQGAPAPLPVDAVILVQDMRNADTAVARQVLQALKRHGITGLGLVENFT